MAKTPLVKENIDTYRKMILWSCDNENDVSSTYSNFLTTLAGFFLALSPLVLTKEIVGSSLFLKVSLSASILFIFLSLIFGGVYIFLKRNFFSKWTNNYADIFSNWNNCNSEKDIEKTEECEKCIY